MIAGDMGCEFQRAERLFKMGRYRKARELCEVVIRIGVNSYTDCIFAIENGGEAARMTTKIDELSGYTLNPEFSYYVPEFKIKRHGIMNYIRKFMSNSLVWIIAVATVLAAPTLGDESAHPVRWTTHVEITSLEEVDQRLAAPLELIDGEDDYLELTKSDKTVRISNGLDYLKRIKEGYYTMTRYDSAMDRQVSGLFIPLGMLKVAKPSHVSYLSDFALDQITLKDLTHDIMIFSESKPDGYTFYDDCPRAVIEKQTEDILLWYCLLDPEDPESKLGYRLKLMAWGDFNGDGIEDVLCDFMYDFVYGFNREAYMVVLTKRSADKRLTLLGFAEKFLRQ